MGVLLPRLSPPFHPYKFFILSYVQLGEMVLSWRQTWRIPSSPGAFYSDVSPTHWGITNTPSFNEGTLSWKLSAAACASLNVPIVRRLLLKRQTCGFTALQTSEIEISDVSQLKQLAMIPHNLFIKNCDSVESLLEDEFLQTNMYSLEICDCSFSRSPSKVGLPTTLKSPSISNCTKLDLLLPELFRCHHPVLENL